MSTPRKYSYEPKVPVPFANPPAAYVIVDPASAAVYGLTYYLSFASAAKAAAARGLAVRTVGWYQRRYQIDPREGRSVHAPDVPVMGTPTHKTKKPRKPRPYLCIDRHGAYLSDAPLPPSADDDID